MLEFTRSRVYALLMDEKSRSSEQTYFDQLAALHMDPLISKIFDKINKYNRKLSDQPANIDEILEAINEINTEWEYLLGEQAVVTGRLSFWDEATNSLDMQNHVPSFCESQNVVFRGVVAQFSASDAMAEAMGGRRIYQLLVLFGSEDINDEGEAYTTTASGTVDDIAKIEFNYAMSPERAKLWLEHYLPDEIAKIDEMISSPGREECELVMRLKGMQINLRQLHEVDEATIVLTENALTAYLESIISFDQEVPYLVTASGRVWRLVEDNTAKRFDLEAKSIAKINRIIWQCGPDDDFGIVRPILEAEFLAPEKDLAGSPLLVPLAVVDDIQSIRYDFFHGYPDSQQDFLYYFAIIHLKRYFLWQKYY